MPSKKKTQVSDMPVITALLAVLLIITVFQSFQIAQLSSNGTGFTATKSTSGSGMTAEEILAEITPTGTPDYGQAAGVSYDNVEAGLSILTGYERSIALTGNDQQRYIEVATTQGNACEFCCGIGDAGFGTADGRLACGCSHNIAFGGLTKWLIQNTDYTNEQISGEIQKWKVLFFPEGSVTKELERRNIAPESVGLKSMVGGC